MTPSKERMRAAGCASADDPKAVPNDGTHEGDSIPPPLPVGARFDGRTITEVIEFDVSDPDMPYQYMLDDGKTVWLETKDYPVLLGKLHTTVQ